MFNLSSDFLIMLSLCVYYDLYGLGSNCIGGENSLHQCIKYQCLTDLLFDFFGFSCFAYVELTTDLLVWWNPNQSNRRAAIRWYFLLQNKEVSILWSEHHLTTAVWPDKNRQMSIKVAQKWFHKKNEWLRHLYKNCLTIRVDLGKIIAAKGFKNLPKVQ